MMISGENTGKFTEEVKSPCTVCRQSVHSNTVNSSFSVVGCMRYVVVSDVN